MTQKSWAHLSYGLNCLNSFKGVLWRIIQGSMIGVPERDTRSLDYIAHVGAKRS